MNTSLSICIIARDEAARVRRCLQSVAPLQCEIIFVDTGSVDETLSIASEYTKHLYAVSWEDDFSAVRNYAAEQAGSDWVLCVDCDEFLTRADLVLLNSAMSEHPEFVGMFTRLTPRDSHGEAQLLRERVARLYNRTLFTWRGRINEKLVPIKPEDDMRYYEIPLTFYHAKELYCPKPAADAR